MKISGWESILHSALERAANARFVLGQHDCATWAFDVVRQLTDGADFAAAWRGQYKTPKGAALQLRKMGYVDFADAGRKIMGEPLPAAALAQRGDLVLLTEKDGPFGICAGSNVAFLEISGLTYRRLAGCQMAWRV